MREVRCIETGETYPSAAAAARAHDVTPGMLNHALKGRQATAAGYTWEYTGKGGKQKYKPRYKGIYKDRRGRIYYSLRSFAETHGYTIRQVQAAIKKGGTCRLIDLLLRDDQDLFAPLHVKPDNTLRVRYVNGTYYINDKVAGYYPPHPQMTAALAQSRLTGKTVTLYPTSGAVERVDEEQFWKIVTPAIETYKKRGEVLTRDEHEAKRIIMDTWITAHPPTTAEFEGTPDKWRPM